ncbi:hypothetical protein LCGC14_0238650 [marine sediment metagenome]|uniref:DUF1844 domain-containing protein n=1 Tax=marine sediment metagenome TaxID=412755 RepID=A0A0F9UCI5_9ZZZZ|nr:DUF1844 domain-containing protein [Phycisphaerae bacterium]
MTDPKNDTPEKPKIIVDDDWKAQAQAEKEKLTEQQAEDAQADAPAGGSAGEGRQVPGASFEVLVSSLVTQAMFALGAIEDPTSKKRYLDLDLAKHHIDMLAVLDEKTKGNLTDDETKLLNQALYESRMHYVQVANAVANQVMGTPPADAGGPAEPAPDAQA